MTLKERYQELARALKGDGCTSVPDLSYRACCDEHDVYYRTGRDIEGQPITRSEADRRLRICMRGEGQVPIVGRWFVPWLWWAGVRLFGRGAWNRGSSDSAPRPSPPASSPD